MIDYRGIEAFSIVLELQSFEAAAKKLHITQSAVSQRIKGLEISYGEPVLIRSLPYRPTKLGKQLIGHFKRVSLLEDELNDSTKASTPHISIAINRDSLETWFLNLIEERELFSNVTLEIIADDQERTLEYLKNGLVAACLSSSDKEIVGGKCEFLGSMEYQLVASCEFEKLYFHKRDSTDALRKAPAIIFDRHDKLHERYLEKYFGMQGDCLDYHIVPSVRGFKSFVLLGYGYALIPTIDIREELLDKRLVPLFPDKNWYIPFYWHSWSVQSKLYKKFNTEIIHQIKKRLR